MGYGRDELVTIGERFPTQSLLDWAGQLVQAGRQDLPRLKPRGITEQVLAEIEAARGEVKKVDGVQTGEIPPEAAARRQLIDAAIGWREEITGLAEAVFDSDPDRLALFRTGVKASRSIPKLEAEIRRLIFAILDHLPALGGVGVTEGTVARGKDLLHALEEAGQRLCNDLARNASPEADLCHAKGVLYTRSRFLRRIAGVEFRQEADRLARYGYEPLRRIEAAAEERRARPVRPVPMPVK